jgi:hypothetical protein
MVYSYLAIFLYHTKRGLGFPLPIYLPPLAISLYYSIEYAILYLSAFLRKKGIGETGIRETFALWGCLRGVRGVKPRLAIRLKYLIGIYSYIGS